MVLDVIQEGDVYRLQGIDDQCGQTGGKPAVVTGIGLLDPSGWIRMGLNTTPADGAITEGAVVRASISLAVFSGDWSDNAGQYGSFVFTPGAGTVGPRRNLVPSAFVHTVTSANRLPSFYTPISCFSHPLTDRNPYALILITPNLGRASEQRQSVPVPVDLMYFDIPTGLTGPLSQDVWCIVREDGIDMPLGTRFTVRVVLR